MSILKFLGLGGSSSSQDTNHDGDTETVRRIVSELESLPPKEARYIAAFAYLLSRVANADLDISDEESREMERLVAEHGGLAPEQAVLAVGIAKSQSRLFGGTENFLVTREFKEITTPEERRKMLDILFAVSAADDSVSSAEELQVRGIATELGLTHSEYIEARSAYRDKREVLRGLKK